MKKLFFIAAFLSVFSLSISFAGDPRKYGKDITLKKTTKISEILKKPEDFLGKKVLLEGLVVDVCAKRGCWIEIASDKPYQKIQVKVKDGEIVFPLTAKGHNAIVEGEVEKLELTKEQLLVLKEHQAKEHGKEFDPSAVTGGTTIYRIKGYGALIEQ